MPLLPMAVYGLEVPAGDVPIPAVPDFPASFQITMAAIDPSAMPEGEPSDIPRATLKLLRVPMDAEEDDDEDDFDADEMDRILAGEDSGEDDSEEDSEDDEDAAGPSDPAKSKKARKAAAMEAIKKLLEQDEMDVDEAKAGLKGKGKAPASDDDEEDDEDDDEDEEIEEFVLCTLDPKSHYQQPLNITIGENERVYFQVSGTHSVFLTGNYVAPDHTHDDDEGEDDEYDLSPDEEDYSDEEYDSEDDLDGMEDPRITEIEDEEEAPKLVESKKGKNKRAAEDLDAMITEAKVEPTANGEKLSKKQLKKMKKNDGTAVVAEATEEAPSSTKSDKKAAAAEKPKAPAGPRVVSGVTIDDKKAGTGPAAKSGDRVGMRYIGKLQKNNKVFDSNKKGKPFTFKLGTGEVIKGWDIGVAGMAVGAERRITIPAHHGYGSRGAPPDIPGGATLVFDVKVVEINKGK
ncbi:hypothetical protein Q7P37_003256 [Cladosporium fusiforme]